jgi:hypothetical protein
VRRENENKIIMKMKEIIIVMKIIKIMEAMAAATKHLILLLITIIMKINKKNLRHCHLKVNYPKELQIF